MSASAYDPRLVELESRLMHQEKLLEQLDGVVIEQQKNIERLTRELLRLKDHLLQPPAETGEEPPPPHY